MTYLLPPSRALSQQLVSRASRAAAQKSCANSWARVAVNNPRCLSSLARSNTLIPILSQLLSRSYATGTGKPKAHTGRPAASKRKPAVVTSDAAAGTPTKAPATKKPARTPTRAAKKTKPKAKPKAKKTKPKPKKKPVRKQLTELQKANKAKREAAGKKKTLKEKALLTSPKLLPRSAFAVLLTEKSGKGMLAKDIGQSTSATYKTLRPEEMERLNHIANENAAKNERAFASWLATFTPTQIRDANNARIQLRKLNNKDKPSKNFPPLKDERIVKRPRTAYVYFSGDRFASGDLKHMKVNEVGSLLGREWKALTAGEKKPFNDRAIADKARYVEEHRNVYGKEPASSLGPKKTVKKTS